MKMIPLVYEIDTDVRLVGFCGVMSIFSSLRYCLGAPTDTTNLYAALAFMPFGLFFDFMDGKVARWRQKASLMGQELDSLADLVYTTFYQAPTTTALNFPTRSPLVSHQQPSHSQSVSEPPLITSFSLSSSFVALPVSPDSTSPSLLYPKTQLGNRNISKAHPSLPR